MVAVAEDVLGLRDRVGVGLASVEHRDLVAALEGDLGDVASDELGAADDQQAHEPSVVSGSAASLAYPGSMGMRTVGTAVGALTAFALGVTLLMAPSAPGAEVAEAPGLTPTVLQLQVDGKRVGPDDLLDALDPAALPKAISTPVADAEVRLQYQRIGRTGWLDGGTAITRNGGRAEWSLQLDASTRFRVLHPESADCCPIDERGAQGLRQAGRTGGTEARLGAARRSREAGRRGASGLRGRAGRAAAARRRDVAHRRAARSRAVRVGSPSGSEACRPTGRRCTASALEAASTTWVQPADRSASRRCGW